ncbi:MAG: hypothetical protein K2K36_09275 [Muribaculaceae bacterium]|nr:hypothetical protein [Muribaculaceae bacterium]
MNILEHIRRFAPLTPELEDEVRALLKELRFRKGDSFHGAVNFTSCAYYVESGSARLFYTLAGKEHTVSFTFPGEFVMISSHVLNTYPDTVAIQFLEPTVVTVVPHVQVKDVIRESGQVTPMAGLLVFNAALLQYVGFLEERVHVMQSMSAEERYRWVIRRYPRIVECANLTQIASYLGLTKETLYRIRSGRYSAGS